MPIDSQLIEDLARSIGFSDCGIARAERLGEEEYPLDEWLGAGCQADMHYLERNAEMRRDPQLLVEGAQTVISLVLAYKPDSQMQAPAKIAQYAYGEDYHTLLKRMMFSLMAAIKEHCPDFEGRPFVDTAPISDRHWAVRAGLGWIGRNTLFIHPRYGSYCFLGEIVTTADIDDENQNQNEDQNENQNENENGGSRSSLSAFRSPLSAFRFPLSCCADCRLCVEACPNHAITTSTVGVPMLDARRCTSYNTIENRADTLPEGLDTKGYAFGCDICQSVCPYNRQAPAVWHLDEQRRAELESLADADEATFHRLTKNSAMNRISYRQWQRNKDFLNR